MKTNFCVHMDDPNRCEIKQDFQSIHDHGTKAGAVAGAIGALSFVFIGAFLRWVKKLFKENQKLKNQTKGS